MTEFEMLVPDLPKRARFMPEAAAGLVGQPFTVHLAGGARVSGVVRAAVLAEDGMRITVAADPDQEMKELLTAREVWGFGDDARPLPYQQAPVKPKGPDWSHALGVLAPSRVEQILHPSRDETRE